MASGLSAGEPSRASVAAAAPAANFALMTADLAILSRNSRRPSGGSAATAPDMSL